MKTENGRFSRHSLPMLLALVPHRDARPPLRAWSRALLAAGLCGARSLPCAAPLAALSRAPSPAELKALARAVRQRLGPGGRLETGPAALARIAPAAPGSAARELRPPLFAFGPALGIALPGGAFAEGGFFEAEGADFRRGAGSEGGGLEAEGGACRRGAGSRGGGLKAGGGACQRCAYAGGGGFKAEGGACSGSGGLEAGGGACRRGAGSRGGGFKAGGGAEAGRRQAPELQAPELQARGLPALQMRRISPAVLGAALALGPVPEGLPAPPQISFRAAALAVMRLRPLPAGEGDGRGSAHGYGSAGGSHGAGWDGMSVEWEMGPLHWLPK